ncbi:hypothetical protein acdb102_20710 [Acidothermaceae bacterium B102]|nr:hypothetical protein acdb102_20710 [Acidothermaceae bacterium B102]
MFGKHWHAARGVIVDKRVVHTTGDGMASIYEFVVEVTTAGGEVFRAKAGEPHIAMDFKDPSVGDTVGIEYDEKSHDVRFDKDDPQLSWKAWKKAQASSFDQSLHATPGTPIGGAATVASQGIDIEALLQAQGITGDSQTTHVVQLDSSSPEAVAVRDALLRAFGQQPPTAEEPQPDQPA